MLRARPALTAAAVAAVAALTLAGCARSGGKAAGAAPAATVATDNGRPTIAARGVGLVKGTPDTLRVVLGVETQAPSAKDALAANNDKANTLINTLKQKGVEAKDIQTSQLSINPTYDNQGRHITGYQVTNQVTATLHDLAGAGALIDAAAGAVGDAVRVQSMGFSIDDDSALKAEARTQAVHLAQLQAEQMAKAAGVKLGPIRLISEVPANSPSPYAERYAAAGAVGDAVRVQSMGFSIDDDSALKAEARTQAVHLAQLQAEQMAKAAGVKLGGIRLISEVPENSAVPVYDRYAGAPQKAAAGATPAPVEPGQQELSLTVDVIWDIAQ